MSAAVAATTHANAWSSPSAPEQVNISVHSAAAPPPDSVAVPVAGTVVFTDGVGAGAVHPPNYSTVPSPPYPNPSSDRIHPVPYTNADANAYNGAQPFGWCSRRHAPFIIAFTIGAGLAVYLIYMFAVMVSAASESCTERGNSDDDGGCRWSRAFAMVFAFLFATFLVMLWILWCVAYRCCCRVEGDEVCTRIGLRRCIPLCRPTCCDPQPSFPDAPVTVVEAAPYVPPSVPLSAPATTSH